MFGGHHEPGCASVEQAEGNHAKQPTTGPWACMYARGGGRTGWMRAPLLPQRCMSRPLAHSYLLCICVGEEMPAITT